MAAVLLAASGCGGPQLPEGAREFPRGADGLPRFELPALPASAPPIAATVNSDAWKINMGLPKSWTVFGEAKDKEGPFKLLIKHPSTKEKGTEHSMAVYCWKGISDLRQLTEKTIATIEGAPTLKPLAEQTGPVRNVILGEGAPTHHGPVWVIPGAGSPAEVHTMLAFHDAGFQTYNAQGDLTGKFAMRYHRTIYMIVKPAPSPDGCNYGITLREYADGEGYEQKFSQHAWSIATSLK